MKYRRYVPLLLALLLTGCGTQAGTASSAEPVTESLTETETATDTQTEPPTETAADTQTEPPTETAPATEAPSETAAETVPSELTDVQKTAYTYIRDELIPQYGLSDLAPYKSVCWISNSPDFGALTPPTETQGLISAVTADLTGDDTPELLTFRTEGIGYVLEWYSLEGGSVSLLCSYSVPGGGTDAWVTPRILLKNDRVVVYYAYLILPGCSRYGNETTVLGLEDGEVRELCTLSGIRTPGSIGFSVKGLNELNFVLSETDDENQHPDVEKTAMSELEYAGAEAASVYAGWGWDAPEELAGDLCYGIYPTFEDSTPIFDTIDTAPDNQETRQFADHTALRSCLALLEE